MKKLNIWLGALLGLLLTAPMIAIMYLANQLVNLPFAPYDVFDWVARILPGNVITFGIDAMIDTMLFLGISVADSAKTAERAMAVLQFLGAGVGFGMVFVFVMKKLNAKPNSQTGIFLGTMLGLPLISITIAINESPVSPLIKIVWLAALSLAWGLLFNRIWAARSARLQVSEAKVDKDASVEKVSRREFLVSVGLASAAITVIGTGLGAVLAASERESEEDTQAHDTDPSKGDLFPNINDPVMPAPGTRPEYTPIKDHYQVFLKTEPSVIPAEGYVLPITGLVENTLMLTLDDIRNNYESRDEYVTLSCISGRIGTSLISTTQWTGVSMQDILGDAGVHEDARYLLVESADGFHESISLDLINSDERIMLCYAWDGNTLPVGHGFPLRIWIPDRFGMKQPKWITSMVLSAEDKEGYWVERNWDAVAQMNTTSVIDTVAVNSIIMDGDQQLIPIGGIAFSGDRGISKVEVRVDSGPWQEAKLRAPLSETTWVIWRYDWPFDAGKHTFEVRCSEGDGTAQIEAERDSRPSGATGIHSFEQKI